MADPSTAPPLTPKSISEAHEKIKSYIHITPLLTSKTMNAISSHENPSSFLSSNPPTISSSPASSTTITNNNSTTPPKFKLYFKCENQQKIGAFKARGAHHALIRLISDHGLPHIRQRGVTTHSSGNHAQALALAAHNFGIPSHIVMPAISTPSKIAGTRMYTDNVVFSGSTSTEREAKVAEVVERTGAILVHPYDHPDIILGQGTAGFEMERQFRELKNEELRSSRDGNVNEVSDHGSDGVNGNVSGNVNGHDGPDGDVEPRFDAVLTPLGGGGLLSGTATWFSHTNNTDSTTTSSPLQKKTLVFGTEPNFSGANDAEQGLAQSPPTRIPHVKSLTIADGLRTPVGLLNWSVVSDKSKVEGVYSVSEKQIKDALRLMMERVKIFVEPSSVVPVAVVLFNEEFRAFVAERQRVEGTGRPWDMGIVLSGGNTTVEALSRLFGAEDGKAQDERRAERETAEVGLDGKRVAEDVAG